MSLRNISQAIMPELSKTTRVALLYQAAPPPAIDNVRKPMKPGGQITSSKFPERNIPNITWQVIKTLEQTLLTT